MGEQPGLHRKRERQTQDFFRPKTIERINHSRAFLSTPVGLHTVKALREEIFHCPRSSIVILASEAYRSVFRSMRIQHPMRIDEISKDAIRHSVCDILQQRHFETFGDIDDMHIMADDSVIAGEDDDYHDTTLKKVADRARKKGVKFNPDKLQYRVSEIKCMCHVINSEEVRADPEEVSAVRDMPKSSNQQEIKQVLGMTKFLYRYVSNESNITAPLRLLLKEDVEWQWGKIKMQHSSRSKSSSQQHCS